MNEEMGPGVTVEGNILRVTNAAVSDRGMYICTSTNQAGTAQAAAILEVERMFYISYIKKCYDSLCLM